MEMVISWISLTVKYKVWTDGLIKFFQTLTEKGETVAMSHFFTPVNIFQVYFWEYIFVQTHIFKPFHKIT